VPHLFRTGLNPYGLTYTLGLQGIGTPRANPAPLGLDGFLLIAREIGARTLELDLRWLVELSDAQLQRIASEARDADMTLVLSTWLMHTPGETMDDARRIARAMGGPLIRMHLAPVLEGARAAHSHRWDAMVNHAREILVREAATGRDEGLRFGIENHQDFGSGELLAFAEEAGSNVGIVMDTGNPFSVGEDPVAFARRVAARVCHVHLKDYRAQFTDEGVRLVRCAIGDGCVPFGEIAETLARHHASLTASLEPAALEARHIRLFTADWWRGYPPLDASELSVALGRLRQRKLSDTENCATPWEQQASHADVMAYEQDHLERSIEYARAQEWMAQPRDEGDAS
jgi:sugar phosphate isomerase/epimerase